MKNLKKLLAITLAATLLLSFGAIVSAAPITDYSEAAQAEIEASAEVLQLLGIVDKEADLNLDRTLTRAEMATILYWMVSSQPMNPSIEAGLKEMSVFNDVADEWFTPFIHWAYQQGLMTGTGGQNFSPLREVTGIEAVILMAKVLGVDPELDKDLRGMAWYDIRIPMLLKAESLFGIPGAFNVDLNSDLTRGEIFLIFRKALESRYVEYSGNKDTGLPQFNQDGRDLNNAYPLTLLEKVYGWRQVTGVVVANEFVSLGNEARRSSRDKIDDSLPKEGFVTVGMFDRDFSIDGYYDIPLPESADTVLDKYSWLAQEVTFYAQVDAKTERIVKLYSPEIEQTGKTYTSERTSNGQNQANNGLYGKINNKDVAVDWLKGPWTSESPQPTWVPSVPANDRYSFIYNGTRYSEELWEQVKGDGKSGGDPYFNFTPPASYANDSGWAFTRTEWTDRSNGSNDNYARSVGYAFRPALAMVKSIDNKQVTFAQVNGARNANQDFGSFFWHWEGSGNVPGNNKAYSETEIKAADIVEGTEYLEKDALVGVFYVGNGKVSVIPTVEHKNVQISRIGDIRNGSTADGDRYNRAIGYADVNTQVWFNGYGSVVRDFRDQIADGEAMTHYRLVTLLDEIVLAERLNDVIFYGAVVSSTPVAGNPTIEVLLSDGTTGRYKLNMAGYSDNAESKWELDPLVSGGRIVNRSKTPNGILPAKKNDAGEYNTPVMIRFRLDGDIATIEDFDALITRQVDDIILISDTSTSINGSYSGSNPIRFKGGSWQAGTDRVFAFYNNSIAVLTEAQFGWVQSTGGAQETVAGLVIDSNKMNSVSDSWDPVYVATSEAMIGGYGYQQVGPGNFIRRQTAINLQSGEEIELTYRWNIEDRARTAIDAGRVARKGQVFQVIKPDENGLVLMFNQPSAGQAVDGVRIGATIQGWVFVEAPGLDRNAAQDGYFASGSVLTVFGRSYSRVGTDLPVITMNQENSITNVAKIGSLSDVSTAWNKKWPVIGMYHQDDINSAAKAGSSDLLYDAKIHSVLVPVNTAGDWITSFDHDNNSSTPNITRGIVVLEKNDVQTDLEQGSLSVSFSFIANDGPITLILPKGEWASEETLSIDGVVTISGVNAGGPIDIVTYDTDPGFTLVRDSDDTITITLVNIAPAQIAITFTADAFDASAGYVSSVVVD